MLMSHGVVITSLILRDTQHFRIKDNDLAYYLHLDSTMFVYWYCIISFCSVCISHVVLVVLH
jgi:hypothetical protein